MSSDDDLRLFGELYKDPSSGKPTPEWKSLSESQADGIEQFPEIPGFVIQAVLGSGGMGSVFKARQSSLDRMVAIKVLSPQLSQDVEFVHRFKIEARTAGKLRHLNIVSALDCGEVGNLRYMVMELVEGKSLDNILRSRGILDERVALEIVKQVAEGLDYAWKHRIIHRDIKLQNIMMTADGIAKICDLGLCKSVEGDSQLTSTGYVYCTPGYASPEQARGVKELDCRTDIFSLGVTFYHLVTGRLPFRATGLGDYLLKYTNESPIPPSERNPKVSKQVSDLILWMMAPDAAKRPLIPGAVVAEIRDLLSSPYKQRRRPGDVPTPKRSSPPRPDRAARAEGQREPANPPEAKADTPHRDLLELAGIQSKTALDIDIKLRGDCAIVILKGRLDDVVELQLTKVLTGISEQGVGSIVVDLSGLAYLNSRGVSVFIAVADILRERKGDLKLAGAKPQALLVLERLGITLIMQHLPTVEEAIDAFRTPPAQEVVPAAADDSEVIDLPPEVLAMNARAAAEESKGGPVERASVSPASVSQYRSEEQAVPVVQPAVTEMGSLPTVIPPTPHTEAFSTTNRSEVPTPPAARRSCFIALVVAFCISTWIIIVLVFLLLRALKQGHL